MALKSAESLTNSVKMWAVVKLVSTSFSATSKYKTKTTGKSSDPGKERHLCRFVRRVYHSSRITDKRAKFRSSLEVTGEIGLRGNPNSISMAWCGDSVETDRR